MVVVVLGLLPLDLSIGHRVMVMSCSIHIICLLRYVLILGSVTVDVNGFFLIFLALQKRKHENSIPEERMYAELRYAVVM